jgi:uncharacterized SAM-binding protein YcdF (DUF218 family)
MVMRLKSLVLLLAFGGWVYGLVNFYIATQQFTNTKNSVDGIVILTGGKDRIQTGMSLFDELRAKRILISGVDRAVRPSVIKQKQLKGYDQIHQFTDIGYGAVNTFSNALESAVWVRNHQFQVIGLVTGRFHIPRSLWLFKKAMPETTIFPIVVDVDDSNFVHLLREYHKYYLTKLVSTFLFDTDRETILL